MTPSARRVAPVAIIAVAAFALVWSRLVPVGQSLWADEIKSVTAYIRPGPAAIYGHYLANDHILFELLTWATTALTGARSAAAYRFWGVVPGIAAAVILTRWLWRRIDPWVAALFALFATASPIYYTLCVDARGYGLGFLAASCVLIGADTYVRTGSRRALGLLGVAAVGGIWTLPVFALPVGAVLGLIALDRRDRLRLVLITAGLVAVASVTLYAPVLPQVLAASRQSFGAAAPVVRVCLRAVHGPDRPRAARGGARDQPDEHTHFGSGCQRTHPRDLGVGHMDRRGARPRWLCRNRPRPPRAIPRHGLPGAGGFHLRGA